MKINKKKDIFFLYFKIIESEIIYKYYIRETPIVVRLDYIMYFSTQVH